MRTMVRSRSKFTYPDAFIALVEAAGFASVNALSVKIGSKDALRNYARGRTRVLRADTLQALAGELGVSMETVSAALELPTSTPGGASEGARAPFDAKLPDAVPGRAPVRSGPLLPVRFTVQAGAFFEVDSMAQARVTSPPVTAHPDFPRDAQWLEQVRGDSVDLFYPEGSFVHVVDAIAIGYAPRHEDFVVVERKREQGGLIERSLKQIAIARRKVELWPRSRNPKFQEPLNFRDSGDDDTTVEIAALVLGGYLPARR